MHEQRLSLQAAERRYADVNRRLAETRASTKEDLSAEALLAAQRKEAAEARALATKSLPSVLDARRETLARLQKLLAEPAKTDEDLFSLRGQVAALEDTVARLTQEVAASQKAAGDDKLAMFRTQSALISKKLLQKEEALEVATREGETLSREIEAKVRPPRGSGGAGCLLVTSLPLPLLRCRRPSCRRCPARGTSSETSSTPTQLPCATRRRCGSGSSRSWRSCGRRLSRWRARSRS